MSLREIVHAILYVLRITAAYPTGHAAIYSVPAWHFNQKCLSCAGHNKPE